MKLRNYQLEVMAELSNYLHKLKDTKATFESFKTVDTTAANGYDYPAKAWEQTGRTNYLPVHTAIGEPLANVWLKIPTGGGKTLLACHSITAINQQFVGKQHGLVLWVVPSKQIYRQTLNSLQDRQHPYRQTLDIATAGRVKVIEKNDKFTLDDIATHLVILVVINQSLMVRNKEGRKVFRDSTGYTSFFPPEDAYADHEALLAKHTNLEYFEPEYSVGGKVVKTSLGNVLRITRPIVIVDEGQKAMSPLARETLLGFNPLFMLELSATPPKEVNTLVNVSGVALNEEQMIKLDLNVVNRNAVHWKDTVAAAREFRDSLEKNAVEYRQNTNQYIRPIMLVQVEATGKDQRGKGRIHADDVVEYLHNTLGIAEHEIAIKSSEKDELIEHADLLAEACPIRYIITKQALQEGWDCSFAYVLCALGNNKSETALTQLVGRILRQPYAVKTGLKTLDESYVYAYQQDTQSLVASVQNGLKSEGLGDLAGHIRSATNEPLTDVQEELTAHIRPEFIKGTTNVYLPIFGVYHKGKWRELNYEQDILADIKFSQIKLTALDDIPLENKEIDDDLFKVGYGEDRNIRAMQVGELNYESELDIAEMTRRIIDIVPNAWVAYDLMQRGVESFKNRYGTEVTAGYTAYVVEEVKKVLRSEIDYLARNIFEQKLRDNVIRFYIIKNARTKIGNEMRFRYGVLNKKSGMPLEKTLYDKIPANANEYEKQVAYYMDNQANVLWWYRNIAKAQYGIKGWKNQTVYPDFIAANGDEKQITKLYVIETKGDQLVGNIDTTYKSDLFELCNSYAKQITSDEFFGNNLDFQFEMVQQSTWRQQIDNLFSY